MEIDVIEQKPITMAELKEKFDAIKTEKGDLNFRANKVHTYLQDFVEIKKEEADAICQRLIALNLRLREKHIVKLIDMKPEDTETIKALFIGEAISLKQEEIKQILDAING